MEYCPYCITKLEKSLKKLGYCTKWFVCPLCGLRCECNDINWINTLHIINEINKKKIISDPIYHTNFNIIIPYEKLN